MHYTLLQFLILLSVSFVLIMLAQKLKIGYPIFLVLAGLLISYIPDMPLISIHPDLIFLIFLPPLLYEAAWYTSWNDFWKRKRAISLLAFGLVFFTSAIVAFFSSALIPGFTLAMGFLLGGIISAPESFAANSVLKNIKIPGRITTIIQGESLVNDASSLIVFRFALAAVLTGHFSFHAALIDFFIVAAGGIVVGLLIAYSMFLIHHYLPTTSSIDAAFSLITPYFMWLLAEEFHFSGVMAVVSGGLFLSFRSQIVFRNGQHRIQAISVWSTLILILNGLIFILIGLEMPVLSKDLNGFSMVQGWIYGLLISLIVLAIRLLWLYPATFIPRFLFKSISSNEPNPGWKSPLIIAWAGMRGVVSLATALSLPLLMNNGKPFPNRSLIIFIAFVVILSSLILQGLTLPFLVKFLNVKEIDPVIPFHHQEDTIKKRLAEVTLKNIHERYFEEAKENRFVHELQNELRHNMDLSNQQSVLLKTHEAEVAETYLYHKILRDLYKTQHMELYKLRKEKAFSDEVIRKQEIEIDLAESKISHWE